MVWSCKLNRIDDNRWEIPEDRSIGMLTNAIIYTKENIILDMHLDSALQQAANVACLPGIIGSSMAMPDIHQGYGFPIGGVAAVDEYDGYITPGGIGFDINCGVRLIETNLTLDDITKRKSAILDELYKNIPSGLGSKGTIKIGYKELNEILSNGSEWSVENGYGWDKDLEVTEDYGHMHSANPDVVSDKARKRGISQLGSLGSGNHFLEIDMVENVFDDRIARAFGIKEGNIAITIHCGSRGCGHQIATDYIQEMEHYINDNYVPIPDKQLACAPLSSKLGNDYYEAMCCGANYAWANRQIITHLVRESFEKVMGDSAEGMDMNIVYDVAHNIAKKERHCVDGCNTSLLVHRKGATRAFAQNRPEIALKYRDVGQPVIIPGDMSTGTYVMVGKKGSMEQTFGSSCHGAGRRISRKLAADIFDINSIMNNINQKNIDIRSSSINGLVEEAPGAYKDINDIIDTVCDAGLSAKVAKMVPVGVIKG